MAEEFFPVEGSVASPADLQSPRARELATCLAQESIAYAELIECRRNERAVTVVFEVQARVQKAARNVVVEYQKPVTKPISSTIPRKFARVDEAIREYREAVEASGKATPHGWFLHDLDLVVDQPREGTEWLDVYKGVAAEIKIWLRWRILWRIPLA